LPGDRIKGQIDAYHVQSGQIGIAGKRHRREIAIRKILSAVQVHDDTRAQTFENRQRVAGREQTGDFLRADIVSGCLA
jgi:hypothetical protein